MYKEIKTRFKNLSENWKFIKEKKEKKRNLKVEDATTENEEFNEWICSLIAY